MEKIFRFLAWMLIIGGLCVAALRVTAIRWWQVPPDDPELGVSLAPSLNAGDWVLLWRLTKPGIGDLVVCPDPDDPTNVVIGRMAAETGDRVTLQGQQVQRNGEAFRVEQNCNQRTFQVTDPEGEEDFELFCDMEFLGGKLHKRGFGSEEQGRKFDARITQGKVFLLSDNRAFPFDSRHYGSVARESCKESLFFRLTSAEGFFDVDQRLTFIR